MITLCRPSPDLSCFRCCPPIRPAGYDHLDYRAEITRRLIENTDEFQAGKRGTVITGFWCWGLGFVDPRRKVVGCLLHPSRNPKDLRTLTGYQEKCQRETCPQFDIFQVLEEPARQSLLGLVCGLDSFGFSSPRTNPLWNLLLWGPEVLSAVHPHLAKDSALYSYLAGHPEPRSRALVLAGLISRLDLAGEIRIILERDFGARLERVAQSMVSQLQPILPESPEEGSFVHRLDLDQALVRFIRFGLNRPKATHAAALNLSQRIETALDRLAAEFIPT